MSRYDGLIIPRSYSEYINKTDAATLQQALQLSGVLSGAVAAGDNKAVTSNAVNGALAEYGNKVDFQKSSVIAFNGTNPNSDINYEIGSVIPFINNLGSDMPASYWYEGIYGKCNGQNIGGLQNQKGVIKAGSIFYAQLVKNNIIYYFDVVTDKLVNQIATKSELVNYIMNGESFGEDKTTSTKVLSLGVYLFLSNMHPLVAADHMGIYAIIVGTQPSYNKVITYIQDVSLSEITISITDNTFKITTRTVFRGVLIKLRDYLV